MAQFDRHRSELQTREQMLLGLELEKRKRQELSMSGNITFSRTVTGFNAGQGVTSPTACTTPGYEVELSMSGKREYTAADFDEAISRWENGWSGIDNPDFGQGIIASALRIASAVMSQNGPHGRGVIEQVLAEELPTDISAPSLVVSRVAAAIRKALLGEAEDAGR